jgi:hypothetical protein
MKPTLTAPGSGRLKVKCDEPITNFAFKSNLRRYMKVQSEVRQVLGAVGFRSAGAVAPVAGASTRSHFRST